MICKAYVNSVGFVKILGNQDDKTQIETSQYRCWVNSDAIQCLKIDPTKKPLFYNTAESGL